MNSCVKGLIVLSLVSAFSVSMCYGQKVEKEKDQNRVLVTVEGKELLVWQIEAMQKYGAAKSPLKAVELWTDIQVKHAEARRRGLDKDRQVQFILELYRDYYLSGSILAKAVEKEMPVVTVEQARKKYDENIKRYRQPWTANVRHIRVMTRDLAEKIIQEAGKPKADFEKLYEKHSISKDDKSKGQLTGMTEDKLKGSLGDEVAKAVKKAKKDDILGPLVSLKGFEIIKVISIRPEQITEFEKAKPGIIAQMNRQSKFDYQKGFVEKLKDKVKIVKSDELFKLEAEAEKAKAEKTKGMTKSGGRATEIKPKAKP